MLGMIYALLPFMVLPIYVSIEQLDLRLLEAASDLGASPLTAFRKITLPLTMPGIAAGTILVFISSLGMFVVPDVMGGAKSALIGNLIQNQFLAARDWPVPRRARLAVWFRAVDCAGRDEPCADYPLLQSFTVAGRGQSRCKRRGVAIFC